MNIIIKAAYATIILPIVGAVNSLYAQDCNLGYKNNVCVNHTMKLKLRTASSDVYDMSVYITNKSQDELRVSIQYRVGGLLGKQFYVENAVLPPGTRKRWDETYYQKSERDYDPAVELRAFEIVNVGEARRKEEAQKSRQEAERLAQQQEQERVRQTTGTLLLKSDIQVSVLIDGQTVGVLKPNESATFYVSQGEHLLGLIPAAALDKIVEEVVQIVPQSQVVKQIRLRPQFGKLEDQRVAAEKMEQQKAEARQKAADRAQQYEADLARRKQEMERNKILSTLPQKYIKRNLYQPEPTNAPELELTQQNVSFNEENSLIVGQKILSFYGDSIRSTEGEKYYRADFLSRLREDRKQQFLKGGFINGTYPNGKSRSEWFGKVGKNKIWFEFFDNGKLRIYVESKKVIGTKSDSATGTWKLNDMTLEVISDGEEIGLTVLEFIPGKFIVVEGDEGPIGFEFVKLQER